MSVYHADRTATPAETAQEMDRRGQVIVKLEAEIARLTAERDEQIEWVRDLTDRLIVEEAKTARLTAENERLRTALATVMGTSTHGQNMTWEERCRIGRAALRQEREAE